MKRLIDRKIPFEKRSVHTDDAIALFRKYGMADKEKLFHYRTIRISIFTAWMALKIIFMAIWFPIRAI